MTVSAYPLRTQPLFQDYIWGGRKLADLLGKELPAEGAWAESWEIIDHPEHQSMVTNGALAGQTLRQITRDSKQWLLGDFDGDALPLLLKYLDCQRVLSVQVHPDDAYGKQMTPPDLGKTEAWYIVAVEPGAVLYAGLREGITRAKLAAAVETGDVEKCLHEIYPSSGDCVFIPAGTVHALGAGLVVAEIQQASNTTFRLFDWNRLGNDGKPRPLHVDQAMEVIDFASGPRALQVPVVRAEAGRERLVECDKFVLERLVGPESHSVAGDGKFHYLTAPLGQVELRLSSGELEVLAVGDSVVIPAAMDACDATVSGAGYLLDMFLP